MLILSRVAETLYWMTRYLERAENTARLINATTGVLLDLPRGAFNVVEGRQDRLWNILRHFSCPFSSS